MLPIPNADTASLEEIVNYLAARIGCEVGDLYSDFDEHFGWDDAEFEHYQRDSVRRLALYAAAEASRKAYENSTYSKGGFNTLGNLLDK